MNDNRIPGLGLIKTPALGWFLIQSVWTSPSQLGLGHSCHRKEAQSPVIRTSLESEIKTIGIAASPLSENSIQTTCERVMMK